MAKSSPIIIPVLPDLTVTVKTLRILAKLADDVSRSLSMASDALGDIAVSREDPQ